MSTPPPEHRPRPQQASARATTRGRARGPLRSPHAAADALVVQHLPFAARVAANYARRTGHPREDLEQLAAIGLIKASRRYDTHRPGRSPNHFIAYARPFVNGEITHYLRDKGFPISVPGRWRELHVRGGRSCCGKASRWKWCSGGWASRCSAGGRSARPAACGWWRWRCGRRIQSWSEQ